MKRKRRLSKNEKYFNFLKLDKKKCPKWESENTSY
jgi:hypothetical protein